MRLFIAEKPALAKDIVKALGGSFTRKNGYFESTTDIVAHCVGHIIESQPPENYNPDYKQWAIATLPLKLYPQKYQPKPTTADLVKTLGELLKRPEVTEIVHAGDVDDEGQLLVDEVLEYFGNTKPVKRILINDQTQPAVKKALNNLKDNREFRGMKLKALARSVADEVYGYSMTRLYSVLARQNGYQGVLSVGRVQTPVLGLVVRRWRENQDFTTGFYYTLTGNFNRGNEVISARWKPSEAAPLDEKKRRIKKDWAEGLARSLASKPASVSAAATDTGKSIAAPLPFSLARLQQYMNAKHGFTLQKTLDITQALRDNWKAITYNRSLSSYLPDEQHADAPQLLTALKTLPELSNVPTDAGLKSKAFNSNNVTAHHAIIPTTSVPDRAKLTGDEQAVYLAIARYYFAQFMPAKTYDETVIQIQCETETFTLSARRYTAPGWSALLDEVKEDSEEPEPGQDSNDAQFDVISRLKTGEQLTCRDITVTENKTKPRPLFTERSLLAAIVNISDYVTDPHIKKLLKDKDKDNKEEHGGIGTSATRAGIIEILKKRNYVIIEKGKFIPTPAALALIDALPDITVNPDMTALWSEKQLAIEEGVLTIDQFIDELYADITGMISSAAIGTIQQEKQKQEDKKYGTLKRLDAPCPNCGKPVIISAKVYACTGCEFKIWNTTCGKKLISAQAENLLKKGTTDLIKGFISPKKGTAFDARITLKDKKTGATGFKFPPREVK